MSSKKCEKSEIFLRKNEFLLILKKSFTWYKKCDIIYLYGALKFNVLVIFFYA